MGTEELSIQWPLCQRRNKETKDFLEFNEEGKTYQTYGTYQAMVREKFIALKAFTR